MKLAEDFCRICECWNGLYCVFITLQAVQILTMMQTHWQVPTRSTFTILQEWPWPVLADIPSNNSKLLTHLGLLNLCVDSVESGRLIRRYQYVHVSYTTWLKGRQFHIVKSSAFLVSWLSLFSCQWTHLFNSWTCVSNFGNHIF